MSSNTPVSVGLHFIQQCWSGNPELAMIIHYIYLHNQTPTHKQIILQQTYANTKILVSAGLHFMPQSWSGNPKRAYLLYFSRTLLPSALGGYTIGRLSLTQLFTSVIGITISLYHLGTSSSLRFRGLPLGRRPSGWITSDLLWGAIVAILLTCDHHLILFAVCSTGCMFIRRLIFSFLILSILIFPAAFLRHLIYVFVNICLSLLVSVHFSLG